MSKPINVLLQTTIESPVGDSAASATENDWHIGRFSMLREYLSSLQAPHGDALFRVSARDRGKVGAPDPVLSSLDRSDYDQLWLFAVDTGDGLHDDDRAAILRFRARGGGLMITRDHMDLGCSICTLGTIGAAHVFHTHNAASPVPPPDDRGTPYIQWPNFHSGANGDFQRVQATLPAHPVMSDSDSETGTVMYLPAHPHEGAVIAPTTDSAARVIATGRSLASGQQFNIAVAFEGSGTDGRAIAESTFHHFADYNWDPRRGSPDFVSETPGDTLPNAPRAGGFCALLRAQRGAMVGGKAVMEMPMSNVSTALARWYADHSSIRRLWAIDEPDALVVFVALEPSSDGDDALPVWLANRHSWTHDLKRATERDVELKLLVSGAFDDSDIGTEAVTIAELSWRDPWEQ